MVIVVLPMDAFIMDSSYILYIDHEKVFSTLLIQNGEWIIFSCRIQCFARNNCQSNSEGITDSVYVWDQYVRDSRYQGSYRLRLRH